MWLLQMREISYIIQNATASSVIIVDELGRGIYTAGLPCCLDPAVAISKCFKTAEKMICAVCWRPSRWRMKAFVSSCIWLH